jgi:hypothetical protein
MSFRTFSITYFLKEVNQKEADTPFPYCMFLVQYYCKRINNLRKENLPTMPRKTFVYPHPINAYIIKQLGITVEEFCELHAFSQGTVSSWITRQKKIETLPISFIYSLSLSASQTMDQVYSDLLKLQDDYLLHLERHRRTKKNY